MEKNISEKQNIDPRKLLRRGEKPNHYSGGDSPKRVGHDIEKVKASTNQILNKLDHDAINHRSNRCAEQLNYGRLVPVYTLISMLHGGGNKQHIKHKVASKMNKLIEANYLQIGCRRRDPN
ncbi:MAG: hypothetical protein SNI45_06500 [Rikenellaceae bacterium]